MASTIRCDIVSAEAEIFHGEAELVVATGELGELGIAPKHAPLITRLKPGKVVVTLAGGDKLDFAISGGILEVQPTVVTVLALPINILAGLFGMNVGGIPLAEHKHGFWIVVSLVLTFTAIAAWIAFRRKRSDR